MSTIAEEVQVKALELPEEERRALAHTLLESCDGELSEDEVGELWGQEITRRLEEIERGEAVLVTHEELNRRLDAVLAKRQSP